MRFQKHKAQAVGGIEAHNERTKTEYKSNPDIDLSRTKDNYNLIKRNSSYRELINKLIAIHKCKTRKDSVVLVETVVTASNEFFRKKSLAKVKEMIHGGSTVLMVSHGTNTIMDNCTKAVWIERGVLKMIGDPKTVCGAYKKYKP